MSVPVVAVSAVAASAGLPIAYAGTAILSNDMEGYDNAVRSIKDDIAKKNQGLGQYEFKIGIDEDWRGTNKNFDEAIKRAFEKTDTPIEEFEVTKWGKDKYGKSHPVEWKASNGAEVSVDLGHPVESGAPTAPHIGWQTGGKR